VKIGIVCPYSFDVPGGVQFHVRDLAEVLISQGHQVSVLAPADHDTPMPHYIEPTGRSVPVRYNGSVARLSFGPAMASKVRRWLEEGHFDVLHLHEPVAPSLSLLALWNAKGPIVATFHTALGQSKALQIAFPLVRPSLEKIGGHIAVSDEARRTVVNHIGADAVVIPNGVFVERFRQGVSNPKWASSAEHPTVAFLGRLDEPRKGLAVLAKAMKTIAASVPGVRFVIAGSGDAHSVIDKNLINTLNIEIVGEISDDEKAELLRSAMLYVAPHTGGESFGIVLVEAMSAGAGVIASDLDAFSRVLDGGKAGRLFPVGDSEALARACIDALKCPQTLELTQAAAHHWVEQFDWAEVSRQIMSVYELVIEAFPLGSVAPDDSKPTGGFV
jgi:phosphatidylinositol alpha-mannosyltransferase